MKTQAFALLVAASLATAPVAAEEITTLNNQSFDLAKPGWTHLVFVNIWDSYAGVGPEDHVKALPSKFNQKVQRLWVSPDMNITPAYLKDYQGYFPESTPLAIDSGYQLMQRYGVWSTPSHVLLKDNQLEFSGNHEQLMQFVRNNF